MSTRWRPRGRAALRPGEGRSDARVEGCASCTHVRERARVYVDERGNQWDDVRELARVHGACACG